MPLGQLKSLAEKSGKSLAEVEKMYEQAKEQAKKKFSEDDSSFYAYTYGILKRMLSISEDFDKKTFFKKMFKEVLSEETVSADVAKVSLPIGKPTGQFNNNDYFDVDDEMFFSLHLKKRGNGKWYIKHYQNTDVAAYAKANKDKDFYIRHPKLDIYRKIKAS